MDIDALIKIAKLGRERKDAQVDTCSVFAAALFDVLEGRGVCVRLKTVTPKGLRVWGHSVVEVDGRYYDSMGEFSADIYRKRARIHAGVAFEFVYQDDSRADCYESEFDALYAFFTKALDRAVRSVAAFA